LSLLPKGLYQGLAATHATQRWAGVMAELNEIAWAEASSTPDVLNRIELGGIAW
jgi:hypothetical protein